MIQFSLPGRQAQKPRARRGVVLLLLSALLHLLAYQWAQGSFGLPSMREEPPPQVVSVTLSQEPPAPAAPPPPQRAAEAKPKPRAAKPKPAPKPRPPPPVESSAETLASLPPAGMETPGTSTEAPVAAIPAMPAPEPVIETAPPAAEASPPAPAPYTVALPPSAELHYDVTAMRGNQKWYGAGSFVWENAGGRYRITGEASASLLLINLTVLNFKSEGVINEQGVAPVLYSEKPRNKSLTHTHFQHDNRKITFSASEANYPYQGDEQDRASIMWQLSGIGRGEPGRFAPGAIFDMVVAGARDAETWRIVVIGEENIETAYGAMQAWHVRRAPRQKAYDQTIDIWLAPQQGWYPVRLRQTSANGDYLDMSLSHLNAGAAPANQEN
ncbi:DUF3108 domain-containing protein [Noviherbaspirillum saxi]|uniref:DUF3108 domain-containing protein n=1 Tax=Noviherbaspirillum saxi TaxID=2320863 RepID=A0A3A3FQY0_9BURK|nr:DUF3108 domain-containing protein [Noviherbaspirillum saxi]RJF97614.1 DUF3108 domain-containing protein [Noviherbaspirillum saxi]